MASMKYTIHVALLDEGTDVWRPVSAELIQDDVYRITEVPLGDAENWEFRSGETVRCLRRTFASGETGLVACERMPP